MEIAGEVEQPVATMPSETAEKPFKLRWVFLRTHRVPEKGARGGVVWCKVVRP